MNFVQKWALTQAETSREVQEKALETFFLLGPGKVEHRATSMIYFSVLEKKLHIMVDRQIFKKLESNDLKKIIEIIEEEFSQRNFYEGFETAIETLERLILYYFPNKVLDEKPAELTNTIIFQ